MLTNVAQTSIDAYHSIPEKSKNNQSEKILSILRQLKDGTTRARIAYELKIPTSTVSARVKPLVESGEVVELGDTRLIPQVSKKAGKVIRIAPRTLRLV